MLRIAVLVLTLAAGPVAAALAARPPMTGAHPASPLAVGPPPAGARPPTGCALRCRYLPPVDGPITDHFRPPAHPYGAGNLGIDWSPAPGTPVHPVAPGTVTFAGQVGGTLHVVVLHGDGIRTTYAFLASIAVHTGQAVDHQTTLGTAGADLHLSARRGSVYLDPEALLAGGRPYVRLVPTARSPAG